MTEVKINWLKVSNFKGLRDLMIDTSGHTTDIFGDNGTFKTTVTDAWHWLWTGKNSVGEAKFNIKNTVDATLNRGDHEVAAGLIVNGMETSLRKVYRENWVKPQGKIEPVLKGHTTDYYFNDVPMQEQEYVKKVSEIIDEQVLNMITNPYFFARQDWKKQRAVLTAMAGAISTLDTLNAIRDRDNSDQVDKLIAIVNAGKSVDEYKKQVAAEKKLKKDALDKIPSRIDENTRAIPEKVDYTALKEERTLLQVQLEEIDGKITDKNEHHNLATESRRPLQAEKNKLKTEIDDREADIRRAHNKQVNDRAERLRESQEKINTCNIQLRSKRSLLESTRQSIELTKKKKDDLLAKWREVGAKVLQYEAKENTCGSCGQPLPADKVEAAHKKATDGFNKKKADDLAVINVDGTKLAAELKRDNEMIANLQTSIEALEKSLDEATAENNQVIASNPAVAEYVDQKIANDARIAECKARIAVIETELGEEPKLDVQALRESKAPINLRISDINTAISKEGERERIEKRIEELKREERQLSQDVADYERAEFAIYQFTKATTDEVQNRIDGIFELVRFKMFDYTLEGNPVETCEVMKDGVPYASLNHGGKVQAGIDIINGLSKHYGCIFPIFLDERESTTWIPSTLGQVVNLIVSEPDKALRIVTRHE